jgi:hypothetical protein
MTTLPYLTLLTLPIPIPIPIPILTLIVIVIHTLRHTLRQFIPLAELTVLEPFDTF